MIECRCKVLIVIDLAYIIYDFPGLLLSLLLSVSSDFRSTFATVRK